MSIINAVKKNEAEQEDRVMEGDAVLGAAFRKEVT